MSATPRLPLPTDRWTRFLLAPALVFIATALDRSYQTDLWHHLARGRAIAAEGRLLDADRFTCTVAGKPLQDANWLWQVAFYQLHRAGGLPLVQAANSLVLAAMMAVLLLLAWRRCGSLAVAVGVCVFTFFGLWQLLIIRPQTCSFLLFVVLYGVLEEATRRRRLLLLPPLLMALWANVHGGFPVGLVLVAAYALADLLGALAALSGTEKPPALRTLLLGCWPMYLCLGACVAATLLNPYGWRVYEYVALTSGTAAARRIDEWLPPAPDMLVGRIWVASILGTLVLCALPGRRPTVRELCALAVFLPFTFGSVRMVAWWLLLAAPVLAAQFAANVPRLFATGEESTRPSRGAALLCGVLLSAALVSLPWLDALNPVMRLPGRAHRPEDDLQTAAERIAAAKPRANVFTRFDWGEYLTWSLDADYKVFMDGRIEIFPDPVWAEYGAVTRGKPEWEAILDRYGVDYLLLDATGYHHELLPQVERSAHWRRVYAQGNAVLFVRE